MGSKHKVSRYAFVGVALILAACTAGPTPAPSSTTSPSAAPATIAPATVEPSPTGQPGSIEVVACGPSPTAGAACLGLDAGTVMTSAAHGAILALSLTVTNPGSTTSSPVSVLLYDLDTGALPFGQPDCRTCNSTTSKSIIGLEWPALAPGETRTVDVGLPVTGSPGSSAWFATLYAQPLADAMTAEISGGIQPGQATWKVATAIASP